MDWMIIVSKLKELFGKYKFVLLVLILGMFFMIIPQKEQDITLPEATIQVPVTTAQELEVILSKIEGVGKVTVMLTEAAGAETIYQTNEDRAASADSENIRIETVIISDSSREEHGLIRTVTPPIYLGAIVVCQGGGNATVKYAVTQAVSTATGIGTDRITVLKMK